MKKLFLLLGIVILLSCEKEEIIVEDCWICDVEQKIQQRPQDPIEWLYISQDRVCGEFPVGEFKYKSATRRHVNCISE